MEKKINVAIVGLGLLGGSLAKALAYHPTILPTVFFIIIYIYYIYDSNIYIY